MENALTKVQDDQKLIQIWLHGRPSTTQEAYERDVQHFLSHVSKTLTNIKLEDLQGYALHLQENGLKERSIKRKLNAIKSLFTFATKLNYTRFNVAAALRLPKTTYTVAHRILTQRDTLKLINAAAPGRDRTLLKLLYATGMRISEAIGLNWEDFIERDDGEMQLSILGKGGKRRVVLVPTSVATEVELLKGKSQPVEPIFVSCNLRRLDRTTAHRIIKAAATKAGVNPKVSNHWMRHNHATHSLNKGAPLHLVRDTLGHSSIATSNIYLSSNPSDSSSNYLGF